VRGRGPADELPPKFEHGILRLRFHECRTASALR
jgi:hypothetical protein